MAVHTVWITNPKNQVSFMSADLRRSLGVSLEQIKRGLCWGDLILGKIDSSSLLGPLYSSVDTLQLNGTPGTVVSYARNLRFNGEYYGQVGTTMQDVSEIYTPEPLRIRIPRIPTISFQVFGVLANHIQAYSTEHYPSVSQLCSNDCHNLETFKLEMDNLSNIRPTFEPNQQFISRIEKFADISFELLNDREECGLIEAVYTVGPFTNGKFSFTPSRVDTCHWLRAVGLVGGSVETKDCTLIAQLTKHESSLHITDDPEAWALCLFYGFPCFLMERPWNAFVETPWHVKSLENIFDRLDVPFQTAKAIPAYLEVLAKK